MNILGDFIRRDLGTDRYICQDRILTTSFEGIRNDGITSSGVVDLATTTLRHAESLSQ